MYIENIVLQYINALIKYVKNYSFWNDMATEWHFRRMRRMHIKTIINWMDSICPDTD